MRKICTLLLIVLSAAVFSARAQESTVPRHFIVIDVYGSPYQRGLQHGQKLKAEIVKGVAIWKQNLAVTFGMNADLFIKTFLAKVDYLPAIRKWTPGLLEEVHGIAAGSGVDFNTILAFQLMDEYWVNGPELGQEHCSAMGLEGTPGHPTIIGQNMDLETFRNGFQTILHIHEASGREELVLTQPGLIAFNGINNRGIAVNTNTLAQLAHARKGLPVAFVVRGVLEKNTYAEAERFVTSVPHASGQNYTIGGPGHLAYFEASAHHVVEVSASPEMFLFHTNHPVVNTDYSAEGLRELANPDLTDNSHTRYNSLEKRLSPGPGNDPLQRMKDTLRSHDSQRYPVSRPWKPDAAFFTYSSTIMMLSGKPCLIASPGPPAQNPYTVFQFDHVQP